MSKRWRMVAVCTVAGSLLTAGALPALAAAPTATITITAKSKLEVTGDALVIYRAANSTYAVAQISGDISGAVSGDVVKLYARPFPFKKNPARLIASANAGTRYSFTVKPTIATRYQAKLVDPAGTVVSPLATVYITSGGRVATKRGCVSQPVCRPKYRVYLFLPPALIKAYVSKHWYVYLGVRLSPTSHIPPAPAWLRLHRATVSKPRRITAGVYERTVSFSFWIGNNSANWTFLACAKDSEARDGVGLPGQHGCGSDHRVPANVPYLG